MARGQESKGEPIIFVIENVRVINQHFFVKNAFKSEKSEKEGTPRYRGEFAFPQNSEEHGAFIDAMADAVIAKYGENIFLSVIDEPMKGKDEVRCPILDGDDLARKREKKQKKGDAYKGQFVFRSDTAFNYEGQDAVGGITVYDEDVKRISMMDKGKVYNGCIGTVKVELGFYEDNEGNPACKFYLKAFQKTGDGEKLASEQDHSSSFKAVGRAAPAEGGRRARRG